MKRLKIGLPPYTYLRYLYISFLKLINTEKAEINVIKDGVEIEARGGDVRPILSEAIKYAIELAQDYAGRGFKNDFPLSKNDRSGPLTKLLSKMNLKAPASVLETLQEYSSMINSVDPEELQASLYPYSTAGDLAPLQAFLLEFYDTTRAPFFDGRYKHKLNMNLHQVMICIAGYLAARHLRVPVKREQEQIVYSAALILPLTLGAVKYDFFRNIRNALNELPGLAPEEAVTLWCALKLPPDFPEEIVIMGVEEPGRRISPISTIVINLNELRLRAGERLEKLRRMQAPAERLLRTAMQKGVRISSEVDDAVEYVKLLYLALQGMERERLELALRASRREAQLAFETKPDIKQRRELAMAARILAEKLI